MLTKLYENIKVLCKENGLSIRKLEIALDFPTNSISDWRKKLPSGERLLIVASYFDVSIDYLLGYTDNRKSHKQIKDILSVRLIEVSEQLGLDEKEIGFVIKFMKLLREENILTTSK